MNKFLLTIASLAPLLAIASTSADAETVRRSKTAQKIDADQNRQGNQSSFRDNSYAARANDRDPAGDYKGYPDWARAALGGSGQSRGSR